MENQNLLLDVWGELACFTRPEGGKVERFSFPIITPSSVRAIFEAIYWKPQFRWQTTRIEVLKPPQYIALRRNEVKNKAPAARTINRWMSGKEPPKPLWADGDRDTLGTDKEGRTQRQTMALKDVRYRLHARIVPWPEYKGDIKAIQSQFLRRARKGQCIYQPYLGCREFPAWFRLVELEETAPPPIPQDLDVGWMVYDVFDLSRPGCGTDPPRVSTFHAQVKQGVLEVPLYESSEVHKPE